MPSPSDWGFQWLKAVAQERTLTPIAKVIATAFAVQFANDEICQINPSNATLAAYVGTLMPAVKQAMEIHLLSGHDFAKPMASLGANTLTLTDTPEALLLEAWIDPALAGVT